MIALLPSKSIDNRICKSYRSSSTA